MRAIVDPFLEFLEVFRVRPRIGFLVVWLGNEEGHHAALFTALRANVFGRPALLARHASLGRRGAGDRRDQRPDLLRGERISFLREGRSQIDFLVTTLDARYHGGGGIVRGRHCQDAAAAPGDRQTEQTTQGVSSSCRAAG